MRFGVNYTPRQGWFHSWTHLDVSSVADDFAAIKELGADHVRIFPLWPIVQPNRTLISPQAIADVLRVVDCAGEVGLDVVVDALNGHLSSYDFLPAWVGSWHRRNLFTDPDVVAGQQQLIETLGGELAQVPHALGLSVGNEFVQFAAPRHPEQHVISGTQAHTWLEAMLDTARRVWPHGLHTHSFDDDVFFDAEHPFGPDHAVQHGGVTTVHSWVFAHLGPKYGAGHPGLVWFARYLLELAAAYGPGRDIWLQEVGAPITCVPTDVAADFVRDTMHNVAMMERLWGITWWCSHDVSRQLADFPELEYSLGLLDADNQVKPQGIAFRDAVIELRDSDITASADAQVLDRPTLVLPGSSIREFQENSHPCGEFFRTWLESTLAGMVPRIKLSCRGPVVDAVH